MTKELYLENSYLKEYETDIISINENNVVLKETIFYPGGGGQPSDKGLILQEDETYKVVSVKRNNGEIYHELDRPLKDANQPVTMKVDWSWRFQNMRYHTLLHVISGYLYEHYNALATSNQIEKDYARLEVALSSEVIEEIPFEQLEENLKELLKEPHEVVTQSMSKEEASQQEGIIKTTINLLPPSLKEIRTVAIEGIDKQACGGTHVDNTSEIGDFSIVKIQKKGALKRRIKVKLN
ncbi:alanyl-tRNA editing protein [Priestia megaterium]|nr:alanyl-tRNA editing protein [Priestia megaterium]